MTARRSLLVLLALAVLAVALVGCSSPERVAVAEGRIPGSLPDDFPIPSDATVGRSVVDRGSHRSEVEFGLSRGVDEAARFYLVNLVGSGYVVESAAGDDAGWSIRFSRDTLRGSVVIEAAGSGSAVVVSLNRS